MSVPPTTPSQPTDPQTTTPAQTVPVRHFWPLLPVGVVLAVVFALWWPDAPAVLHALVGTVALVLTATVVVLLDGRRSRR